MRFAILLLAAAAAIPGCSREISAPPDPPAAAVVEVISADARPYHVTVAWAVLRGGPGPYLVQRRHDDRPWKGLAYLVADARGRLVLEDPSAQPGQPYAYRVRVAVDPAPAYDGEIQIEVPA